ncbi:type III pantothenate kinase [uncultured Treponema sp.]|uniref:type III pantothenate kinase n=1 Tax=uncultured Treponema sp. TaxID=162155 RepID=UPI0025ED8345|nr:type III pantothenate kinase [uncultured Treponema sp.]
MILTLDIGNTQLSGGVFSEGKIALTFRCATTKGTSSDELGIFLRSVLRENGIASKEITDIAICSVVPSLNYAITSACVKYFGIEPLMIRSGIKTGLKLRYSNPREIGADRIAAAIGASFLKLGSHIIVVDMGTATTVDVITRENEYFGGAILPGINMMMHALSSGTAQLPSVEIVEPEKACGSSTVTAIQSGLYWGTLGSIRELISRFTKEVFKGEKPVVIATGGFSNLFKDSGIFDRVESQLVLDGLRIALELNK